MRSPLESAKSLVYWLSAYHSPIGVLGGIWLLSVTVAPIYKLSGAYQGLVSLSWYTVTFHGSEVKLAALDAVRVTSLAPLALAFYLAVAQPLIARLARPLVAAEASVGGALALEATGFAPVVLARYVGRVLASLEASLTYRSSAGLVWLGEARVEATPVLALASMEVYAVLAALYLVSSIAALDRAIKSG